MLGNGRLEAQCFDGVKRLAHIRGKMRKKQWVRAVYMSKVLSRCFLYFRVVVGASGRPWYFQGI